MSSVTLADKLQKKQGSRIYFTNKLAIPGGLRLLFKDQTLRLGFNAVAAAESYELQWWVNEEEKPQETFTITQFEIPAEPEFYGKTVKMRLRAVQGSEESLWSTPRAITVIATPEAPEMRWENETFSFSWNAVEGAESYEMVLSDNGQPIAPQPGLYYEGTKATIETHDFVWHDAFDVKVRAISSNGRAKSSYSKKESITASQIALLHKKYKVTAADSYRWLKALNLSTEVIVTALKAADYPIKSIIEIFIPHAVIKTIISASANLELYRQAQTVRIDSYMVIKMHDNVLLKLNTGNNTIDISFGTEGVFDYGTFSGAAILDFMQCGSKIFGCGFNSGSNLNEIWRLDVNGQGLTKVAALNMRGSGAAEHMLYMKDDNYLYLTNYFGNGHYDIVKFNTATESIEVDYKTYYFDGMIKDASGQLWIIGGNEIIKVDHELNKIGGADGSKYLIGGAIYQYYSPDSLLYVKERINGTELEVYIGSVDAFLGSIRLDGTLEDGSMITIPILNEEIASSDSRISRILLLDQILVICYYIHNGGATYTHNLVYYDLVEQQYVQMFNNGAPLMLNTTHYNKHYNAVQLFQGDSAIYFIMTGENNDIEMIKFTGYLEDHIDDHTEILRTAGYTVQEIAAAHFIAGLSAINSYKWLKTDKNLSDEDITAALVSGGYAINAIAQAHKNFEISAADAYQWLKTAGFGKEVVIAALLHAAYPPDEIKAIPEQGPRIGQYTLGGDERLVDRSIVSIVDEIANQV